MESQDSSKQIVSQPIEARLTVPKDSETIGYVQLPLGSEDFNNFMKSLLGNPQAVERRFSDSFELNQSNVLNLNNLIVQRIKQQNGGVINFFGKLSFSDNSSVEFNSVDDMVVYNEVKNVVCVGLYMRWNVVVKFNDKEFPEKQQILVSFGVNREVVPGIGARHLSPLLGYGSRDSVLVRIEHTARTWGVDMESMIVQFVESVSKRRVGLRQFVYEKRDEIGTAVGIGVMIFSALACAAAIRRFSVLQVAYVYSQMKSPKVGATIQQKVELLTSYVAGGHTAQFYSGVWVFFSLSCLMALVLGIWTASAFSNAEPSFLLFNEESLREKSRVLACIESKWRKFVLSAVCSVLWGIIGNAIFTIVFANLPLFRPG